MNEKNIKITKLILNIIIVILEIIGFVLIFNQLKFGFFIYYTQCSNLLLLITSCMLIYGLIKELKGEKLKIDSKLIKVFEILRYTACLSVFVTILVVLTVLGPIYPEGYYGILIKGSMLYHHLLCPVLAIVSFILFEKYKFDSIDVIRSLYFTVLYSIVLLTLNIAKVVDGPYPFLKVYNQPVITSVLYFVGIIGGALLLSYLFRLCNGKLCLTKNHKKK